MNLGKEKQTVQFVSFLSKIFDNRKLIARNFMLYTIIGLVVALLLPFWYTSTAVLLPPEAQGGSGLNVLSMVADLPLNLSGAFGLGNSMTSIYIGILNSRNVREAVVERLDLMTIWEEDLMEDTLRKLDDLTRIDLTEEGLITISTTARTRKRAQSLCQAFVSELDRLNKESRLTNARYTREFIERRFKQADVDLRLAAEDLRDFQEKNGVISIEDQVVASITAAARLKAEVTASEVEQAVLAKQLSPSHQEVKTVQDKIAALRDQLGHIQFGNSGAPGDMFIPFKEAPNLSLQYVFLYRDLEVQKAIYELLAKQYEHSRIQEARDTPTVQVLDSPSMPERKSKPKRVYIVLAAAFLSFFVSGFTIALDGYMERVKNSEPDEFNSFHQGYEALRNDFRDLFRFRKSDK